MRGLKVYHLVMKRVVYPVRQYLKRARHVWRLFQKILQGKIPLIGVGGILSGEQAVAKQQAGASLVQIYSGMIYTGPILIKDCVDAMI